MSRNMAALTDPGLARTANEDSVLALELPDGSILLAVADGVGGLRGGDVASAEAIAAIADESLWAGTTDPRAALEEAFSRANRRVRELGQERGTPVASTLVAALVRDGSLWVTNVGDSRAYLFDGSSLTQLSHDHSLVAEQVRAGILTAEEGEHSDYRNVITRGIGVEDIVEPDGVGPVPLPADSILLLCSDGLHGPVAEAQIKAALASGTVGEIARGLIDMGNEAGGPDNISVVILKADSDG